MPKGRKKISNVDLFVSELSGKVLTAYFNGEKNCKVAIPEHFTIAEVNEICKKAKSLEHMVYTKENGVLNLSTASATVKYTDTCYIVVKIK